MKSTKLDKSGVFEPFTVRSQELELALPPEAVHVRNNGVEFLSHKPLPVWSELTVDLQSPSNSKPIHCHGIVVGSHGNRHSGFVISILFMSLGPEAQSRIDALAEAQRMMH